MLSIEQFLVVGFVIHLQAVFKRSALYLFVQLPVEHGHRGFVALSLEVFALLGQLLVVAIGLPLPGTQPSKRKSDQQGQQNNGNNYAQPQSLHASLPPAAM
ncbi:hypothetical protein [Pseudomonas sp. HLS-6 TE3448]